MADRPSGTNLAPGVSRHVTSPYRNSRWRTAVSSPVPRRRHHGCQDYRKKGYLFNHNYYPMANNGMVTDGIDHGRIKRAICFTFEPNLTNRKHARNTIGSRSRAVG